MAILYVQNYGTIANPALELMGVGVVHHLNMGPEAILDSPIFLPEFQAATIVADTPLRLAGGLGLGVGSLILEPGSSLQFTDFGGLGSGTVEANGNEISITGSGSPSTTTIDRGVIVEGLLYNEGLIEDGDHPVRIVVLGDIENFGSFTNSRITLHGSVDQAVGVGPGIAADEFVMGSGLQAEGRIMVKKCVLLK